MRSTLSALSKGAFFLGAIALFASSCATAGVRYVVMSIDQAGLQPRSTFFTDSQAIYCVAKYSGARADATLDFVVRQTQSFDWDNNKYNTDENAPPAHPLFAGAEQNGGVQTEGSVAFQVPPTGILVSSTCTGYCMIDPPPGVNPCDVAHTYLGVDTCGYGSACCFDEFGPQVDQTSQSFPYPVGSYECDVYLDGKQVGSEPFNVIFPDASASGCPPSPPAQEVPCRYWVQKGTQCTGFAAGVVCTCNNYTWSCK